MSESKSSNKKPIQNQWWFWVIIVVAILAIGAGLSSKDNEPKKVGEGGSEISQNGDTDNSKTFKVGDVIAVEGMEISVISVQRNWTGNYRQPKDGKEYILVNLSITNKTDDKANYYVSSWKIEDGDGAIESEAFVTGNDDSLSSGELARGGTKKGSIVFEVPRNDTNLKIHYSPNLFSDRNETIIELQ